MSKSFRENFPFYLSIGMTYDQYWNEDPELVKYYRKANVIKAERENYQAWLQGLYIYEAIADLSPILRAFAKKGTKPNPYRDSPIPLTAKDKEKERELKEKKKMEKGLRYMEAWVAKAKQKEKKDGNTEH